MGIGNSMHSSFVVIWNSANNSVVCRVIRNYSEQFLITLQTTEQFLITGQNTELSAEFQITLKTTEQFLITQQLGTLRGN
jgi:hypothetical protein